MNLRRFALVLLVFAVGLLLYNSYVARRQSQREKEAPKQTTAEKGQEPPTSQPTTKTTTQPDAAEPEAPQPPAAKPTTTPAEQGGAQKVPESQPGKKTGPEWISVEINEEAAKPVFIGSLDEKEYPFRIKLINRGAAVESIDLAGYFTTVADKQLHAKDPGKYEQARLKDPKKYKGHYSLLNPVAYGAGRHLPFATRSIGVLLPDAKEPLQIRLDNKFWEVARQAPSTSPDAAETASFTWTLYRDANYSDLTKPSDPKPFLKLVKTYQVKPDSHSVIVSLRVENLSSLPLRLAVDQAGPTGLPREDVRSDNRRAAYGRLKADDQTVQPILKPNSEIGKKFELEELHGVGSSDEGNPLLWLGHVNKFFGCMMYLIPHAAEEGKLSAPEYKAAFYVSGAKESAASQTFLTGVEFPALQLGPGQAQQASFDVFAGPKMRGLFYGNPLYDRLKYIGTIDFRGCFCAWDQLSLFMMWLLEKLAWVAFGNYGLGIILLVIVVRLALHPLTKKGQVSMMKMQKLSPQMQKLKEKYADDKNALNREMMQLYKQGGITPILGCLPMLLQMPIWIALWTAVDASAELRHAAFLPVWITDLAAPDAVFKWSAQLPLIGNSLNLLPLLLTVAMFLQTKLTPQMGQVAATPQQEKQQQFMKFLMPVMMLVIFYPAPSGLTLYIMASTFAGVAEQYVIRKHIRDREAQEAATETTVRVPGKGPRSNRPKKPKGPFWIKKG